MVLAGLLVMLLMAERGTSMMWRDTRDERLFLCATCDLRYPRNELRDREQLICPRGHTTAPTDTGFPFGTVVLVTCLTFIGGGAVLVATGAVPTP